MNPTARLELRGITKHYPSVVANQAIDLVVQAGEIHAVLGENGAGKSTLMKIIYGVVKPDAGEMLWNGAPLKIQNPAQARQLGIGMVFQHFSLFETLTVTQNIALALEKNTDSQDLSQRIREISERYGLTLEPARLVHSLSVGERQRVEIVRCLLQAPKLLIMDEPTSVLTPQAVRKLFETLRRLSDEGCSILYVSHKLDEIRELCHKATVLRAGQVIGSTDPREKSARELAEMMIGSRLPSFEKRELQNTGDIRLEVKQLSRRADDPFGTPLQAINLQVRSGEIVGIAGVSGNGQQELMTALSGEYLDKSAKQVRGDILLKGKSVLGLAADQRRQQGLRFVPEERLGRGAVPAMSLSLNALLTGYDSGLSPKRFINYHTIHQFAATCIEKFRVKCNSPYSEARSLSGGNVQKFIVGRELMLHPEVLLVAQPTWGVDVGAAVFIRQALLDLRAQGIAILVVSEELDELFEICDRIAVIYQGQLSEAQPVNETNREAIGLLMGGAGFAKQEQAV
ncbi:ABC transporter ATP-binding protein [Thiolinea disciformis]|uniref:ABC transporter ATP-binding protein n=1 Tax=Thiolinea disciformis TaxID=125614 RepID=UPI0003698678|nr:ABC transporter ATP-binding protein [Thiolinea disciformis]